MAIVKRKLTTEFEKRPIKTYFNFKAPDEPHPKVKVLEKGQTFVGSYQHTFKEEIRDKETGKVQTKETHLIYDDTLDALTLPGCKVLNEALAQVKRGDRVEITFLGRGKKNPKQKLRKPPYLFDVSLLEDDSIAKPAPASTGQDGDDIQDDEAYDAGAEPETEASDDSDVEF